MDPDPAIFVIDLQDASKKLFFNTIFSAYYFLKIHLHHLSKMKSQKESQNSTNQGFSYYFCMIIEGSGSGSIPLTSGYGSGSWRPKNMWIRIRNTDFNIQLTSLDPDLHNAEGWVGKCVKNKREAKTFPTGNKRIGIPK
jgi:hypothetical protein